MAAAGVLREHGLQGWSVDRVAAHAGCAKGLVAYHHGSKKALLEAVAHHLRLERNARRLDALSASGAEALDRLWLVLVEGVGSGEWAALSALRAEPGIAALADSAAESSAFASAIGAALELPPLPAPEARLATAALDGLQLALHLGAPEESVHEAYHRLWLSLLP